MNLFTRSRRMKKCHSGACFTFREDMISMLSFPKATISSIADLSGSKVLMPCLSPSHALHRWKHCRIFSCHLPIASPPVGVCLRRRQNSNEVALT